MSHGHPCTETATEIAGQASASDPNFLPLAIVFFTLAIVSAVVGMRGVGGVSIEVAKILVFVFLVLSVVTLLL